MAIAAFATWHDLHEQASRVVSAGATLPAHAGFETFSVLTRLPEPTRATPDRVSRYLHEAFGREWLALPGTSLAQLVVELAERDIRGGAAYDALIGATARSVGAKLYTCDRRALTVYARLGVEVELLG